MKSYVGNKIRELRNGSGMTQAELAAKLGISASSVGMYEQGRREPDSETILKLCSIFGTSTDYLLGNTKTEKKSVGREISDVFDEFTQILTSQQTLMFDGVPLNDDDRSKIVDAIRVVAALAQQQHKKSFGNGEC